MQERTYATPSPRSFACDLATLCAPTLAGLKPASLFRYQPAPGQDAAAMAAAWHTELSPRGVTVQVLKQCPRIILRRLGLRFHQNRLLRWRSARTG